ncbi:MAG: hypothetical protein ACR2OG_16920 [Gemmatimonadaceae bacterium]
MPKRSRASWTARALVAGFIFLGSSLPGQDSTASPRPRHGVPKHRKTAHARSSGGRAAPMPFGRHSGDAHRAYRDSVLDARWPVPGPAPLAGSILPVKRIVAFYGNPLSKRMGILGEFPPEEMLRRLDSTVAQWQRLDPQTPVQPALHLIAVVAQASPGRDGKYRLRMDSALIERVYSWAAKKNALLFLDLQIAQSTLQAELPRLEAFLKRPDVHLAIDPEFSMHHSREKVKPGRKIGVMTAGDVNVASAFLQGLVDKYTLPPKVLVVHRFTKTMVTKASDIRLDPRVQVVIDMDGFGPPWLKRDSFYSYVKKEPVQFAGWKQFTKRRNDHPPTPIEEILRLRPAPLYIQYQ